MASPNEGVVDPVSYPCSYEGGFAGMRASDTATLELTDEMFAVTRKRSLWTKTYRVWARWSAVTGLDVTDATATATATPRETDEGDEGEGDTGPVTRVALITKARGMGTVVVPGVTVDELWAVLDQLADLAERFHTPEAPDDEADEGDEGAEGDEDQAASDPTTETNDNISPG